MAVTYGFYNSLNKDRMYNAEQMSSIFNGVITDGVFSTIGNALTTVAGTGLQVIVKPGKAWFNGTWTLNDALLPLDIETADVSLGRIDAVILEVDSSVSVRANSIKVLKGTASANPVKPTLTSTENVHQYALAYVTVAAGATSITAGNIEINVGKSSCPFVTSVLQQTNIDQLFTQWEAEFDAWFSNVQSQLSGDVATNLQRQIDEVKVESESHLTAPTKELMGLQASSGPDDAFRLIFNLVTALVPVGYGLFRGYVIDQFGNKLSDMNIYIYKSDDTESIVSTLTSRSDGLIQTQLKPGEYILRAESSQYFWSSNDVPISIIECQLTMSNVIMSIVYSSKEYITESIDLLKIPNVIDKYDVFAVGGGGGGAVGYQGACLTMCGGAGGYTAIAKDVTERNIKIIVGTGGAGGVVNNKNKSVAGTSGGTTQVGVPTSGGGMQSSIAIAYGGAGGSVSYNTPLSTAYANGGSASGYSAFRENRDDDLITCICSDGRSDGESSYPLKNGERKTSDTWLPSNTNFMGTGQGSTTREFGEPKETLYCSGAGAVAIDRQNHVYISRSGEGAGESSYGPVFTTEQINQSCDAVQYGCGGGCAYSNRAIGVRGGNGKQGLVVIRWNVEHT